MSEPMAVLIDPLPAGITFMETADYEAIKEAIGGGWLEGAPTDGSVSIYIDEDGKGKHLPINLLATAFWTHVGGAEHVLHGDFLVGPVVVIGPPDAEGDDRPIPPAVTDLLVGLWMLSMEPPE